MYIKTEMGFNELYRNSWSGAKDTLETVENYNKEDELMALLEVVFDYEIPTDTEVNDFLWFEDEYIFDALGIETEGDED